MFSPAKRDDMRFQLELVDLIETLVRLQAYNLAEKMGDWYVDLETKIKTYDYSKDDELYETHQRTS
jgi:hypothetical protein